MSKICLECKAEFDDNMKFCSECGSRLEDKVDEQTLVSIGDANAISGGVHVQDSHNVTNYDNSVSNVSNVSNVTNNVTNIVNKKTQEEIRLESMNILRKEVELLMERNGHINSTSMEQLKLRCKELGLRQIDIEGIVRDVIVSNIKSEELNEAGERILINAKEAIWKNDVDSLLELEKRMESIAAISTHDEVQFVYFLILALADSDKLVKIHNEQVGENYWRTFWTIALCICSNDFDNASKLLVSFSPSRFGKPQADLNLLEAILCIKEGKNNEAIKILDTNEEHSSDMLEPMLYAVRTILDEEECSRLDALFFKQFLDYFEDEEEIDDDADEQEEYIIDEDPNAPYDPQKDLPLYKLPPLSLLSQFVTARYIHKGKNISAHSLYSSKEYIESPMELPCYIGKEKNSNVFFDLTRVPHLLIEGGQKNDLLEAIFTSLVFKKHPAELKFVMLGENKDAHLYEKISCHFLARLEKEELCVISDIQKIVKVIESVSKLMDERNTLLKHAKCKNITEYNSLFKSRRLNPMNGHEYMHYIVVIIQDLDDVIMPTGREMEKYISRLTKEGHTVGIHVIAATQFSNDSVLAGLRENFPMRLSTISPYCLATFSSNSKHKSRKLEFELAFLGDNDLQRTCDFIAKQQSYNHPCYLPNIAFREIPLCEPQVIVNSVKIGSPIEPILRKECFHVFKLDVVVVNAKGHKCTIAMDNPPFITPKEDCMQIEEPDYFIHIPRPERCDCLLVDKQTFMPHNNYTHASIVIGYYIKESHVRLFEDGINKCDYTIRFTSDKGLNVVHKGRFRFEKIKHFFYKNELRIVNSSFENTGKSIDDLLYYLKEWFGEFFSK